MAYYRVLQSTDDSAGAVPGTNAVLFMDAIYPFICDVP